MSLFPSSDAMYNELGNLYGQVRGEWSALTIAPPYVSPRDFSCHLPKSPFFMSLSS